MQWNYTNPTSKRMFSPIGRLMAEMSTRINNPTNLDLLNLLEIVYGNLDCRKLEKAGLISRDLYTVWKFDKNIHVTNSRDYATDAAHSIMEKSTVIPEMRQLWDWFWSNVDMSLIHKNGKPYNYPKALFRIGIYSKLPIPEIVVNLNIKMDSYRE